MWSISSKWMGKIMAAIAIPFQGAIAYQPLKVPNSEKCTRLFAYGILKRNFQLDLENYGATFIGEAVLQEANIYKIGSGVGLKLEDEGKVYGEVFEIPNKLWRWLDGIEGRPYNYDRMVVEPVLYKVGEAGIEVDAWVYVYQRNVGPLIESGKYEYVKDY